MKRIGNLGTSAYVENKDKFGNIAPFLNMLFYGNPGTGKSLVAKEIARKSGLDYAMMTGGHVAALGSQAITKIHEIFDWSKKSKRGLVLFIDDVDTFLCE
ncbi:hypothetical protein E3N88_34981 [Mikania micrantha]|uniref:ATPase AAA-type core domain-containing protein n=1 Tax=Mikania micrantha TaxID=192012 RepID=A0A5N6LZX8_9ASTR|nr:hypothetical protein E3N88_34981 [Mikania micrantha]